ncbi:hypothetical protein V5799_008399 [Amblyomma americanum]|uniref:Uncharacterized protein n=1 Tax=Amblyomma americanum TaxID=6943 RepID=A0AAQ4FEU4_AMBAM
MSLRLQVAKVMSACPVEMSRDVYHIDQRSQEAVIAISVYLKESGFQHYECIVPYPMKLLRGLLKATFVEEVNSSDALHAEVTKLAQVNPDLFCHMSEDLQYESPRTLCSRATMTCPTCRRGVPYPRQSARLLPPLLAACDQRHQGAVLVSLGRAYFVHPTAGAGRVLWHHREHPQLHHHASQHKAACDAQFIRKMRANMFRDEDCQEKEADLYEVLNLMVDTMANHLMGKENFFYEFDVFTKIAAI